MTSQAPRLNSYHTRHTPPCSAPPHVPAMGDGDGDAMANHLLTSFSHLCNSSLAKASLVSPFAALSPSLQRGPRPSAHLGWWVESVPVWNTGQVSAS